MKNNLSIKSFILSILIIVANISCSEDDNRLSTDESVAGAYLRTISNTSAFSINDIPNSKMNVLIEEVDAKNGGLLQDVKVYATYTDSDGSASKTERLVKTFPASAFTKDATTGYLRTNIVISLQEFIAAFGITSANLTAGDVIVSRLVLTLTNGKTITDSNNGQDLNSSFYLTPFVYTFDLACTYNNSIFSGNYKVVQDDWADYAVNDIVPVTGGSNSNEIRILSTNNPYLVNSATSYIILTVNPITQNVTVSSNQSFDYGGGFIVPLTGSGKVNSCNGEINVKINFGTYSNNTLILRK